MKFGADAFLDGDYKYIFEVLKDWARGE